MLKWLKENFETVDLSDIRLLLFGVLLLCMPILWFIFFSGVGEEKTVTTRLSFAVPGKQSAFNLTSSSKATASSARKQAAKVDQPPETIESELERAWSKIKAKPRIISLPPDMPPDTRKMLLAEEDEMLIDANTMLDRSDLEGAEKAFAKVIADAGDNTFKELFAWGGLMEVYQFSGNVEKFRQAFANYAKAAQKLHHIYGPLADNVARAYEMFDQMAKIDSGKIRQYLTRSNLSNQTNTSYEDFLRGIENTRKWFPSDLQQPEPRRPDLLQPNDDG